MNKRNRVKLFIFLTIMGGTSIIFILVNILFTGSDVGNRVVDFLPGVNMMQQIPIIFYSLIITSMIGVFIGVFLSPLLLRLHIKIIGKKLSYELQEVNYPPDLPRRFYSLLPAILAVSLSLILAENETIINMVLSEDFTSGGAPIEYSYLVGFVVLLPLTSIISFMLFIPILVLLESGIVFSTREKVKNKRRSEEVKNVGGWYYSILKGYVGIGAIITFVLFIFRTVTAYPTFWDALPPLIILPLIPFLIMFFSIPAMFLFELVINKRLNVVRNIAIENGIKISKTNQFPKAEIR
ncbi:MAG: hypothetical protein GF311_20350 [Candidatus Lokiarchaeota archaeon]|nr:hypothetical protein [Candidatus Lokiarchaeota archaeon]